MTAAEEPGAPPFLMERKWGDWNGDVWVCVRLCLS
ncbi:hypothetical protein SAEN111111_22860 [Saccharibacillus endophyticus]